jgi:hypothetical protein
MTTKWRSSVLLKLFTVVMTFALLAGSGAMVGRAQDAERGGTLTWAFILKSRSLDPNVWTGRSDNDQRVEKPRAL